MRKLTTLFWALLIYVSAAVAQHKTCCSSDISSKHAALASNTGFALAHHNPLPFTLTEQKGKQVTFTCPDGTEASAYLVAAKSSNKFLFVFHEWWGVNDYIKQEADKLSEDLPGVNILAIDLYDGKVAATREDAQVLVAGMKQERSEQIVHGAFAFAGKKARVATLGWCMGGSWSLQAAIIGEKKVKGCVMYYGYPEQQTERLKHLRCEVLGIFAEQDKHISVTLVKYFEDNMKKAGKKITVYNYVADHAFANPSNPQHNAEATKDAYSRVLPFLQKKLKANPKVTFSAN